MVKYISRGKTYNNQGEYRRELVKRKGFNFIDTDEQLEIFAKTKGFKDYKELLDIVAVARGFTCYEEYYNSWKYYPGMINPLYEDRLNLGFIGHIAEIGMIKVCTNSQAMKHGNPGYDFICNKGYKIDVKGAMINAYNRLTFHIRKNKVADYFILVAFNNNILDISPFHIWLMKGNEVIKDCPINNHVSVSFGETDIGYLQKYEMVEELGRLKEICIKYNDKYENLYEQRLMDRKLGIFRAITTAKKQHLRLIPKEDVL